MSAPALRLACVALAAAALAACGPGELGTVNAHISVAPEKLEFGDRPVLDAFVLDLAIGNSGQEILGLSSLRIEGGEGAFTLVPGTLATEVARGSEHVLQVRFLAPEMKAYAGTLVIESDDRDTPRLEVPLTGAGTTAADAVIEPRELDFGRVGEGRSAVRRVKITSTGTADLKLKTLTFKAGSSPAYGFVGSTRTPAVVRARTPGEDDAFVELTLKFAPDAGVTLTEGWLVIETTAPGAETVEIHLTAAINRQPLAVPGPDQILQPGRPVSLDGSASSDPDGDVPLSFKWTLATKPEGSAATLTPDGEATTGFTPDLPGTYLVELVVTDAAGLASKPGRVKVNAATSDNLVVELVWDHPVADLDLHLREEGAELDSLDDCFGANRAPDFGANGDPDDDPFHAGDKLSGFGPERVVYEDPRNGRFQVAVKYVSAQGSPEPALTATVRVYLFGVVQSEASLTMTSPGTVWDALVVEWPTGNVTPGAGVVP
jgi:hypothetical protein